MRRKGVSQDQTDFAEFYAESRDDCLRTVFATVRDVDHAQDLVAEAFARAWASWRGVRSHPAPRAWVIRTALNLSVSSWRRHRRVALRIFLDLDTAQTAEVLGIAPGTVTAHLTRALTALRTELTACGIERNPS